MRKALDYLFSIVAGACALGACAVLVGIVAAIAIRGASALGPRFLFDTMREGGAAGGIAYHVAGTLILCVTAVAVATPLALALALAGAFYLPPGSGVRRALRLGLYVCNGVPSIVFGILGMIVFVRMLGWGKSWLAGGLLLGAMMLPTVATSFMARMDAIPARYLEAAAGLGLKPAQIAWHVVVPQSAAGLMTGALLGLARVAGETAPILFTATVFSGAALPRAVKESPVLSLPYHIFVLAQDSLAPEVVPRVWATAVVLLALVFAWTLAALPLRLSAHEEAERG